MIRSIEYADLSAIREINAQVLGYDIPLEQTKIQFERCSETNGHTILVFEDDETGQVSGQATFTHKSMKVCIRIQASIFSD